MTILLQIQNTVNIAFKIKHVDMYVISPGKG